MRKFYIIASLLCFFSAQGGYRSMATQSKNNITKVKYSIFKESLEVVLSEAFPTAIDFIIPISGKVTSPFGRRNGRRHTGIDIPARKGTAIKASNDGVVCYTSRLPGYGLIVTIKHANGFKTRYAHCSRILVKTGDLVKKMQIIAEVGNTGRATGSHLHFEVIRNNVFLDPMTIITSPLRDRHYICLAENS